MRNDLKGLEMVITINKLYSVI